MKTVKPPVSKNAAKLLIKDELKGEIQNFVLIEDGQIAQSFSFSSDGHEYILQFNYSNMSHGFRVERFLSQRLSSSGVPIRRVIKHGYFDELHYTLSEKIQGEGLDKLSPERLHSTLPSVLDILLRIASTDISGTTGYGWLNEEGNGMFSSWQAHLKQVKDEEPGCFYGEWHTLFETSFLERDRFDQYYNRMVDLLEHTPNTRELVHGGFGYGNTLVHDSQVVGVLDWTDARYGDALFDVAGMDFWNPENGFLQKYLECCQEWGIIHEHFEERILCYKYYDGIDAMRFFAKTENRSAYDYVLAILEGLS